MDKMCLSTAETQNVVTIKTGLINAMFTQIIDNVYEVVLEISSQKFLIRFSNEGGSIESFEILSIKGFVYNLTSGLILALRNIVQALTVSKSLS